MGRLTRHEIEKTASELMYYKDKLANGIFGDKIGCFDKAMEALKELQRYKDLEEQGRLIDWRKTSEEKPDSTRHLIVADGETISHYGYYLKPKDKWFTNWKCEDEISVPMFWMDMPEPPIESLQGECGAKMELDGGMKNRLIELLRKADDATKILTGDFPSYEEELKVFYTGIANYLLDNGVIVLPCAVGDTLY